jgi:hypothetical protein
MEAWMGDWNGTETLNKEKVVFNKLRGRMVFYFTDNEVTHTICTKGSSKTLSLHFLVQQIKALELALGCRLITQGTDGLSRGIWENGFNTDF